jgi:hypothetical protein
MQTSTSPTTQNYAQPESNSATLNPVNTFNKRIGSMTYRVSIHWGAPNSEKLEDKILRLIKNDLTNAANYAIINSPQMVRLPERSSL